MYKRPVIQSTNMETLHNLDRPYCSNLNPLLLEAKSFWQRDSDLSYSTRRAFPRKERLPQ